MKIKKAGILMIFICIAICLFFIMVTADLSAYGMGCGPNCEFNGYEYIKIDHFFILNNENKLK